MPGAISRHFLSGHEVYGFQRSTALRTNLLVSAFSAETRRTRPRMTHSNSTASHYPCPIKHFVCRDAYRRKSNSINSPRRSEAGLPRDLVPYLARHECGTKVCRQKGIEFARRMLGHANISTTQRYMYLDDRELADAQDLVE